MPADLDAPEQIGLRTRHLEHTRGVEARLGAENLRIGQKRTLVPRRFNVLPTIVSPLVGLPRAKVCR